MDRIVVICAQTQLKSENIFTLKIFPLENYCFKSYGINLDQSKTSKCSRQKKISLSLISYASVEKVWTGYSWICTQSVKYNLGHALAGPVLVVNLGTDQPFAMQSVFIGFCVVDCTVSTLPLWTNVLFEWSLKMVELISDLYISLFWSFSNEFSLCRKPEYFFVYLCP